MQKYIKEHKFLGKIFPKGISQENVLVSELCIKISGDVLLSINTRDEPNIAVDKWGTWNKDYNVVVINILFSGGDSVSVTEWRKAGWGYFNIADKEDRKILRFFLGECSITMDYDCLLFQNCDRYLV